MSFGKFTRQEIIDLISGSWSPYWSAGGGTPGGPNYSIQFNSASIFSGSNYFTYDPTSGLYYTGSFFVSGAISASTGPNTVGFYGTASWAVNVVNGGTGTGTPGGPYTSIQFNSGGFFSGSSNFTFNSSSKAVYLTGSLFVSGAISASYGPNTVGFYGTSSWAISASWAPSQQPSFNGTDQYITRFSGSTIENSTFVNSRTLSSFSPVTLNAPFGYDNAPASQSFIIGQGNKHLFSHKAVSIGDSTRIASVSSSLTINFGTGVSNNYDVAMNYLNSTAPRVQFKGLSLTNISDADGGPGVGYNSSFFKLLNGAFDNNKTSVDLLFALARFLIIYDHIQDKIIDFTNWYYGGVQCRDTLGATFTGQGLKSPNVPVYTDGTTVSAIDNGLFTVFLINDSIFNYKANLVTGVSNAAYGIANQSHGYNTLSSGIANNASGIGSVVMGSGSVAYGRKNAVTSHAGTALGIYNAVGKSFYVDRIAHASIGINNKLFSRFPTSSADPDAPTLENNKFRDYLQGSGIFYDYNNETFSGKTPIPATVIIPSVDYCGVVEFFIYDTGGATPSGNYEVYCTSLLPTGSTNPKDLPHYAHIILHDDPDWYNGDPGVEQRTPFNGVYNVQPSANTAIGYSNASEGVGAIAGGIYSLTRGSASLAFGEKVYSVQNNAIVFGNNITNNKSGSFMVGFSNPNLFVQTNWVGIGTNPITRPYTGFAGLYTVGDILVTGNINVYNNLIISGSTYLGNALNDSTVITGSLYVSNSIVLTGNEYISGSLQVTGSQYNLGSFTNIGTLTNTGSVKINGDLSVTGFQVIGGNVFLGNQPTDFIRVTGSVQMTGSLNVIGPVTANNVFLTGSYNGNLTGQVTGSLTGSFIGTGSGNFNGNFIGIYTGSINPGISFYGTSSWAQSSSVAISSSFSSMSSNVYGGATNYIPVWSSATSLSSSAATDNGTLFLIKRNTEISGTFENNVSTAINQSQPAIKTNTEGVFSLGTFSSVPTATAGGMYFDGTDFYLGI